jgi:hypothetical protein
MDPNMFRRTTLASLACIWLITGASLAGLQPEKAAGGGEQPEEVTDRSASNPGPEHERLAKLAGTWETSTKFEGPGMEAEESKGESKLSVVLGGRFLREEDTGTMMGQPYTSLKFWGFNNGSKKYESVWMYTGGTAMMTMTGESKDEGKTVVYDASYVNEVGQKQEMKITFKQVDVDHFAVTLAAVMEGAEAGPSMTTTYTRKK